MSNSSFEINSDNDVTTLTLNNPERHNALDASFWNKFPKVIHMLQNENTRVLILKANGKSFCSGLDTSMFSDPDLFSIHSPVDREKFMQLVKLMQDAFSALRLARFPVIAAIQGPCIGAGLDLVAACDLRYATSNAFFRLAEINLGLMADLGTLQLLPESLPASIVNELAYTGRDFASKEAKESGFLNNVFDDKESMDNEVLAVAKNIASKAPLAIYQTKLALKYRQEGHGVTDALAYAGLLQTALLDVEAIKNSFSKNTNYPDLKPIVDTV